jgi:hypothetical protein
VRRAERRHDEGSSYGIEGLLCPCTHAEEDPAALLRVTIGEDFEDGVLPALRLLMGERPAAAPVSALRRPEEGEARGEALEGRRGELAWPVAARDAFGEAAGFAAVLEE